MADKEETNEKEIEKQPETNDSFARRFLPWIMLGIIVLFCAAIGLGLGRMFASSRTLEITQSDSGSDETTQIKTEDLLSDGNGEVWYYELDPVVANLNEPNVTRYVRATFTLEISSGIDQKKGTEFLDEKKPIVINWLTVYLSSLTLEDIRGDKNLRSIQSHVCEALNESLFPDSKPQIKQVLIKEFPVQ